jgi:LPS export ABC transporter protein LptC
VKGPRWLLGLAAAIAILAAAFLLGRSGSTPGISRQPEVPAASRYNFVAHDVVVRQTGDDGQLQYRLEARHVEQRPGDNRITASDLTMHYEAPLELSRPVAGSHWIATADRAELPEDGSLVQLRGAVQVTGQPPTAAAPVTMATSSLTTTCGPRKSRPGTASRSGMGQQRLQAPAYAPISGLNIAAGVAGHGRVAR